MKTIEDYFYIIGNYAYLTTLLKLFGRIIYVTHFIACIQIEASSKLLEK